MSTLSIAICQSFSDECFRKNNLEIVNKQVQIHIHIIKNTEHSSINEDISSIFNLLTIRNMKNNRKIEIRK